MKKVVRNCLIGFGTVYIFRLLTAGFRMFDLLSGCVILALFLIIFAIYKKNNG